jgi:hypothetical protein
MACIGVDGEEKKRGLVLSKGKVNRIRLSCFSWADKGSPTDGPSYRHAEVLLSKGLWGKTQDEKGEDKDKKSKSTQPSVAIVLL